jgi:hypothetical protein
MPDAVSRSLAGGGDGGQDHGRCALDTIQRLGQRLTVALVQMQVVLRCPTDLQPDGFADDERDGFRFKLARVT